MPELTGGVATGIGSLPGTDIAEAIALVFGELPELPHLPELPARGPGADLIGRGASLLVDLPVQLYAGRWQTTARPGMDLRRARDFLERDLDALTDARADHDGRVKLAACGPWTLAASLHRNTRGALVADAGAVREIAASLAEGLSAHVAEVASRLPHASVVLQVDEPSLPAALEGTIPTDSGLSRYRPVETDAARAVLSEVIAAVDVPVVVHCCAPDAPIGLLRDAGAAAVALDLSLIDLDVPAAIDPLGEALEAGFGLVAGAVPALPGAEFPSGKAAAETLAELWNRLGLARHRLAEQVIVSPACGLAGATPSYVREALTACREAADRLHG
ncbi:MAG TPA: methionine synthase [Stackebrandtia sp.]|jgi:methionine synthase II (cobalamin-independent)|uniref:methionine synthase n=1 Tax=Stackebrandtia sp. TaxID=2023065 RepID=UPI002D5B2631|nr:methionine synthase [Stackebrandtia sp.]HZE41982.1 methionine synthase [Stackebrandtia sp.]